MQNLGRPPREYMPQADLDIIVRGWNVPLSLLLPHVGWFSGIPGAQSTEETRHIVLNLMHACGRYVMLTDTAERMRHGIVEGRVQEQQIELSDGVCPDRLCTDVTLSQAFDPFINSLSTVYPLYTPKNAGSVAADYQHPLSFATLRLHIDAAYSDGQYTSATDPTLSDRSVLVNGRIALGDIGLQNGGRLQVSLWSRNLLDEQHSFFKTFNTFLGTYAIFNEPRTFGVEGNVRF